LAEAKKPRSDSEEIAKLQQQLKAARTRIQTLAALWSVFLWNDPWRAYWQK
jgi:hypothetical protein